MPLESVKKSKKNHDKPIEEVVTESVKKEKKKKAKLVTEDA